MDLQSTYHLQSLNQMLELSEINTRLRDLHSIRELDVDGDHAPCSPRSPFPLPSGSRHLLQDCLSLLPDRPSYVSSCTMFRKLGSPLDLWSLCLQRTPCLVQRSALPLTSEGPQPGTKTKGFQNLYCYIPSLSFFEQAQRYQIPLSCTRRQN